MHGILRMIWGLPLMAVLVLGCASTPEKKAEQLPPPLVVEEPEFILHDVKPGETMAGIAKWYTGKEGAWRELAQHNPDLKPSSLKRGDQVKVPVAMATAHSEPPRHSTAPRKQKKARNQAETGKEGADASDSTEFFGPR